MMSCINTIDIPPLANLLYANFCYLVQGEKKSTTCVIPQFSFTESTQEADYTIRILRNVNFMLQGFIKNAAQIRAQPTIENIDKISISARELET